MVIACDPGTAKPSAFALKHPEKGHWSVLSRNPTDWWKISALLRDARMLGVKWLVLEDIYLGKDPQTFKRMAIIQGALRVLAYRSDLKVHMVMASRWKSILVDSEGVVPKTHAQMVRRARRIAEALTTRTGLTEDETIAVCIAQWGMENFDSLRDVDD